MTPRRLLPFLAAACLAACAAGPGGGAASAQPVSPESLAGTRWVGVVGDGVDPRHLPRLEFVAQGRLSGFTGCNMMMGSWKSEAGEVRLGPVATTKRFCMGPEMDIEKRVLAALGEARLTREGDTLVFTSASGARMAFKPA